MSFKDIWVSHLPRVIWAMGKAITTRRMHPKGGCREIVNKSSCSYSLSGSFFNDLSAINPTCTKHATQTVLRHSDRYQWSAVKEKDILRLHRETDWHLLNTGWLFRELAHETKPRVEWRKENQKTYHLRSPGLFKQMSVRLGCWPSQRVSTLTVCY